MSMIALFYFRRQQAGPDASTPKTEAAVVATPTATPKGTSSKRGRGKTRKSISVVSPMVDVRIFYTII